MVAPVLKRRAMMKVDVRFHGVPYSAALRDFAERLGEARLHRFAPALAAVVVGISDENGPRGGMDKRCRITVFGPALGTQTTEEYASQAEDAVASAFDRVEVAVARRLARSGSHRPAGLSSADEFAAPWA
jgi:hypothetical protein